MTTSHPAVQTRESFTDRHARIVFVGLSLIVGFFGVSDIIGGASNLQFGETVLMHSVAHTGWNDLVEASPYVANLIDLKFRTEGGSYATIATFTLLVCMVGFRRGERWAWYGLWLYPIWMALTAYFVANVDKDPSFGTPVPIISDSVLAGISALALVVSSPRFFRKNTGSG